MKKIEAVISPEAFASVHDALARRGVEALTVSHVYGAGVAPTLTGSYRGSQYRIDVSARVRIEIVVTDAQAGPIAYTIMSAARVGRDGDGVVSVVPVLEAIRIRTGERGTAAISDEHPLDRLDRPTVGEPAAAAARI